MHTATTRAAELERENEELRTKQAQPPAQEAPPAPTSEEMETQVAEVLTEIDNLDPYAEDYATQRAKLWTKVANLRGGSSIPDESKVTEIVRRTLDEENQQPPGEGWRGQTPVRRPSTWPKKPDWTWRTTPTTRSFFGSPLKLPRCTRA